MSEAAAPMIDIRDLNVTFTGGRKPVRAVNGVTFSVPRGEVLALLGESGSGKSVTLRSILNMHPKKRTVSSGSITAGGLDVMALSGRALADYRGKLTSMIFQEPLLAFDPVYTVGAQIVESIRRHEPVSKAEAYARALGLLQKVKIPSAERRLAAYPHEMSGGMRQRAMIALALACNPQILLADEPTTALDATVQIQILLLLRELQRELGLTVILVTHDIGVAVEVADRVAVMYAGRIVETGPVREIIRNPRHPYTQGLLASRAHGAMTGARLDAIPGAPPDLSSLPPGCAFRPRCKFAVTDCETIQPDETAVSPGHWMRCLRSAA
ncbi:MAG: ABC transporter ATP-binding protein [Ferrovibrio sp.]|nr:ABC transporter ATP-binding protein [Alphaproteobacteria bacterium]